MRTTRWQLNSTGLFQKLCKAHNTNIEIPPHNKSSNQTSPSNGDFLEPQYPNLPVCLPVPHPNLADRKITTVLDIFTLCFRDIGALYAEYSLASKSIHGPENAVIERREIHFQPTGLTNLSFTCLRTGSKSNLKALRISESFPPPSLYLLPIGVNFYRWCI